MPKPLFPLLHRLHRRLRRLPLPLGSRLAKGRPPLRLAQLPLLAAGGRPLRAPCIRPLCERPLQAAAARPFAGASRVAAPCDLAVGGCRPCGLLPPQAAAPCRLALAAAWPWVAGPAWGLAVA
ncbi:hypothetical protein BHE74_00054970, partial [Ensete ventricosum]